MPNYSMTWSEEYPSVSYCLPEEDPIKYNSDFKQIRVSFCPDLRSKIKIRFGSALDKFSKLISLKDFIRDQLNPSIDIHGSGTYAPVSASCIREDSYTTTDNRTYRWGRE